MGARAPLLLSLRLLTYAGFIFAVYSITCASATQDHLQGDGAPSAAAAEEAPSMPVASASEPGDAAREDVEAASQKYERSGSRGSRGRGGGGAFDSEGFESEEEWMLRWADEEGLPLKEYFTDRAHLKRRAAPGRAKAAPPRGILVGPAPGPETIDWEALANVWDYDENPWTPTQNTLVGPLSTFQEVKKALPPKLLYGVVFFVLLVSTIVGPLSAAKNAQIATKRREIAQTKLEVVRTEKEVAALREAAAEDASKNATMRAVLAAQKECLGSLSALRRALYPVFTSTQDIEGSSAVGSRKVAFGPEWAVFSYPTDVRIRMLREWGDVPAFLRHEVGRLLRILEKQQQALDARVEAMPDFDPASSSLLMPITDSREEGRKLLEAARSTYAALNSNSSEEYSAYVVKRAGQLMFYGLVLQRQQELRRDIAHFNSALEALEAKRARWEVQLHKKRQEIEKCVNQYMRLVGDVQESQGENLQIVPELAITFKKYVESMDLPDLTAFSDSLHALDGRVTAENLTPPIARQLVTFANIVRQKTDEEIDLYSKLGNLQASGEPESQQAAESVGAACETIGFEFDRVVSSISAAFGEISEGAVLQAKEEEQIRLHTQAVANAQQVIDVLQPLILSAKTGALDGIV
ncbi:hypothetical protein ACSSS7_002556 [Eimeria intestinalis]